MEKEEIRKLFPYLKSGKIYFNHASVGPMPSNVAEALNRYAKQRSAGVINNYKQFLLVNLRTKKKLAKLLHCPAENIAWGFNVGSAMSMLAQGLNFKSGDRIILGDIEFPSNVYPFLNLRHKGVEVDFVKSENGILKIEDYEKLITPKTKLISVSLVQFLTGFKIDLKKLGEICNRENIVLAVDAIQAAGAVNIDLKNLNVDFLTGGAQKWLLGLQGLAYFYVSSKLQEILQPSIVGWQSVANPWSLLNYDLTFPNNANKYLTGTPNVAGIFALNKSLDVFLNYGLENVFADLHVNVKYLMNKLVEVGLSPLLLTEPDSSLSGIVSVNVQDSDRIKEELAEQNIIVETREGLLRISPHFYNTREEIDAFLDALRKII